LEQQLKEKETRLSWHSGNTKERWCREKHYERIVLILLLSFFIYCTLLSNYITTNCHDGAKKEQLLSTNSSLQGDASGKH